MWEVFHVSVELVTTTNAQELDSMSSNSYQEGIQLMSEPIFIISFVAKVLLHQLFFIVSLIIAKLEAEGSTYGTYHNHKCSILADNQYPLKNYALKWYTQEQVVLALIW